MQDSKRTYEAPVMEVILLENADVICTSGINPDYAPGMDPAADNDISFWG